MINSSLIRARLKYFVLPQLLDSRRWPRTASVLSFFLPILMRATTLVFIATPVMSFAVVTQDILVAYTQASNTALGFSDQQMADAIRDAVAYTAKAQKNSGAIVQLRLVGIYKFAYEYYGTAPLNDILRNGDGVLDEIHAERSRVGADIVAFIHPNVVAAGATRLNVTSPSHAFLVARPKTTIGPNTIAITLAHEIGHMQGLYHYHWDPLLNVYGCGYNRTAANYKPPYFSTVTGGDSIPYYSNPNIYYQGVPMGVDPEVDPSKSSYSVRKINETAYMIGNFVSPPDPVGAVNAPENLISEVRADNSVRIVWQNRSPTSIANYVWRLDAAQSQSEWSLLTTLPISQSEYIDQTASAGRLYKYMVSTSNGQVSANSNTQSAMLNLPSNGWTFAAVEGETFSFPTWVEHAWVRYGANGKYAYKFFPGGYFTCDNITFGDPEPGVPKICEYTAVGPTINPLSYTGVYEAEHALTNLQIRENTGSVGSGTTIGMTSPGFISFKVKVSVAGPYVIKLTYNNPSGLRLGLQLYVNDLEYMTTGTFVSIFIPQNQSYTTTTYIKTNLNAGFNMLTFVTNVAQNFSIDYLDLEKK